MKKYCNFFFLLSLLTLTILSYAQTPAPSTTRQSFLVPGDSLWAELSLSAGDYLKWSLRLANASQESGETVFTVVSDVDGEIQRKAFNMAGVDLTDSIKISKQARYRLMVKSTGTKGRLVDFALWPKLGKENRLPFPMPTVQRFAEKFSPGDVYTIEYEFMLAETTKFATLLALDLPRDLVNAWAITSLGDSLTAQTSVSRWLGETGTLSFSDRKGSPKGGRLTLKLELDIGDEGDATVYIGPGSAPPAWLPKVARTVITHRHDPWSVIAIPPLVTYKGMQLSKAPEVFKSPYIAQSLRIHGVAPDLAARIQQIYVARDSLVSQRRVRLRTVTGYDSLFLLGDRAFLPPDLHAVFSTPLSEKALEAHAVGPVQISWFVETKGNGPIDAKLIEWRYDAARMALDAVPDEFFWDSTEIPLQPQMKIYLANKAADRTHNISFNPAAKLRPSTYLKNGELYRDYSRRTLGLFLENSSRDTVYLVYHQARVIDRPLSKDISKLPNFAKTALLIMAVLALAGVFALFEIRRRERNRKKLAEELDAELAKAREVQLKLLPRANTEIQGLEVLGLHQSMQSVGGDYYDFFQMEDGTVILCVADVAGHGLPAALLMSNLQATLRAVASAGKESNEIISLLNREMFTRTSPDRFVTMFLCEISPDRKKITACNAGHNPSYIIRRNGDIEELDAGGIMLGVMDIWPFIQMDYSLQEGDLIVLYTDGIPEATIGDQDMFGYDRLKYFLQENRRGPLQEVATKLFRKVMPEDSSIIEDDMCVVLVRVK